MIGTIIGDIVGSPYESYVNLNFVENKDFPLFCDKSRFTDDTVLTCATADAILDFTGRIQPLPFFHTKYKEWALRYPDRGYGSGFSEWIKTDGTVANNSYANGCMMRCSPIGLYFRDLSDAKKIASESIKMTHNSAESERGVQSIVSAISLALKGKTKLQIKEYVEEVYGHMLDMTVEELRLMPKTTIRCNVTTPQALICFMESTDYESAIRNAVYTKGDTDTIAAIAGSIAEAFYGVRSIPQIMIDEAKQRLTPEMIELVNQFYLTIGEFDENYKGFQI